MDENRADKMADLKETVARGQYRVDAKAVADAILCRMREEAAALGAGGARGGSSAPA